MNFREQRSSSSSSRGEKESHIPVKTEAIQGREEGVITKLCRDDTYGFIKPDNDSYGKDTIFFHRSNLVNKGSVLRIGDRVQFRVSKSRNKENLQANDIFVQVSVDCSLLVEHLRYHGNKLAMNSNRTNYNISWQT